MDSELLTPNDIKIREQIKLRSEKIANRNNIQKICVECGQVFKGKVGLSNHLRNNPHPKPPVSWSDL